MICVSLFSPHPNTNTAAFPSQFSPLSSLSEKVASHHKLLNNRHSKRPFLSPLPLFPYSPFPLFPFSPLLLFPSSSLPLLSFLYSFSPIAECLYLLLLLFSSIFLKNKDYFVLCCSDFGWFILENKDSKKEGLLMPLFCPVPRPSEYLPIQMLLLFVSPPHPNAAFPLPPPK